MMRLYPAIAAWLLCLCFAVPALATEYEVQPDDALFAIMTQKGGFASGKAHDHFITAKDYAATLQTDDATGAVRFTLTAPVSSLEVDAPAVKAQWIDTLLALGVRAEPFTELDEKQRAKVTQSMLAKGQLDAARFPEITATLKSLTEKPAQRGEVAFTHEAVVAMTVHGQTVELPFAANVIAEADTLRVTALGMATFSDCGIKPFSAFLGAVRNEDAFYVYVNFSGTKKP